MLTPIHNQVIDIGYLPVSVSQEFQAILMLEPPYLLYSKEDNSLICKLQGEAGRCEYLLPLMVHNKWTRVDLSYDPVKKNKIIGFNLTHLGEATFFIPRIFTMSRCNEISLDEFINCVNIICEKAGLAKEVFDDYTNYFRKGVYSHAIKLSVFDIDNENRKALQRIITRDSLSDFGMRLLS